MLLPRLWRWWTTLIWYSLSITHQFCLHSLVLYNYGMIFLYKSFFVNYILSFSLVGLRTIRLLVQVHRHWVQFTLTRRGYDNHNCHNKPQIGNKAGVWMTSCSEVTGWEFGYFEKYVSWVLMWVSRVGSRLWASQVGSLLGTSPVGCRMGTGRVGSWLEPCRWTVEVEFWPWCWEVWVSTVEGYGWVFRVPTSEDERRSKTPWDVLSVWVLLAYYDMKGF